MKTFIDIPDFKLTEKIYESDRTLILRGAFSNDTRPVVIKMLNKDFSSPSDIERITAEYAIVSNIHSSGAIKFYNLINVEHSTAIVMEDIGGISLEQYLRNYNPDLSTKLRIAIEIAVIIGDIHSNNIIHKDINPGNIIINPETKIIKLIDFSIAAFVRKEVKTPKNPEKLEGTLAYISPEQTGRMNRTVDFRTDFYSFGATLFQMFTGVPPFRTVEPMALIHSHIAVVPPLPSELNTFLPLKISEIIMKLLSKTAEDRYQSAYGLRIDIEKCYNAVEAGTDMEDFVLGLSDISESLCIPEKLYGRNSEVHTLADEFDQVSKGKTGMIFFAGPSGIGKSYLVNEIQKPLINKRGFFISGKFDRFKKDMPYYAIIQAFQDLIRQILTGNEEKINTWKKELLDALGVNGRIIIDIIPELELIIGKQPEVPELNLTETQNRFNYVFQRFIMAFAGADHPLVLFLDDLQWADSASIKLLDMILCRNKIRFFLLLGAYRDNEVINGDPLMILFDEFKKNNLDHKKIVLNPFDIEHIDQLICDTLFVTKEESRALSVLVKNKTDGNPFFVKEFIINLYKENFIVFKDRWSFDLDRIISANITDNVVVLMSDRVKRLSEDTRAILQIASCIGVSFNMKLLSQLCGQAEDVLFDSLSEAVNEGMIIKSEDIYRFAHDRVRDAVYSLIDIKTTPQMHYIIGRKILETTPGDDFEDAIFTIVYQLNSARELIFDYNEKIQLAEFNLLAGMKAKSSTAYEAALEFFKHGIDLLPGDAWSSNYRLTLSLYTEIGEIGYILGKHELPEKYFTEVLRNGRTALDKIRIYEIEMAINTSLHNIKDALKWGRDALKLLDVNIPSKANPLFVMKELVESKIRLTGKNIEDLINIPEITDPRRLAIVRILMACTEPAYIGDPDYFPIVTLKLFNQTLKYGSSIYASYAYVFYGVITSSVLGNIGLGYRFGKLGLSAVDKFNAKSLKCKVFFLFSAMINHWKNHMSGDVPFLLEAFNVGTETGDLAFSSYSINYCISHYFFIGRPLAEVKENYNRFHEAIRKTNQMTAIQAFELSYQLVTILSEFPADTCLIKGDIFNEEKTIPVWLEFNDMTSYSFYVVGKEILFYFSGKFRETVEMALEGKKSLGGMMGMIFVPQYYFYYTLAMLAVYGEESETNRKKYRRIINKNRKLMKKWAEHSPSNHQHKYLLIEAEKMRIKGDTKKAGEFYKKSIELAGKNGFLHEEAIANELAALFYLSLEMEKFAANYMTRAYNCYSLWGATVKVQELQKKYSLLILK